MSLINELLADKAIKKNEEYERTLCSVYDNVKKICEDGYLRHCILSEIEAVYPEVKEKERKE
jgi:hypothetical protein